LHCSTCGAQNADGVIACAECDEPFSGDFVEGAHPPTWLQTIPAWLRWIVALPGVAIIGSIVVRRLEFAGLDDISSGIFYPSAVALAMFAAAHAAAFAAPSYRRLIGLAVAIAELSIFLGGLLSVFMLDSDRPPSYPVWIQVLYLVIPIAGVAGSALSLARSKSLVDEPMGTINLPVSDLGLRWGLGMSVALATGPHSKQSASS